MSYEVVLRCDEMRCFHMGTPSALYRWPEGYPFKSCDHYLTLPESSFNAACIPAYPEFDRLLSQVNVECLALQVCATSSREISVFRSAHNSDVWSLFPWVELVRPGCDLMAYLARQAIRRPIRQSMKHFCVHKGPGHICLPQCHILFCGNIISWEWWYILLCIDFYNDIYVSICTQCSLGAVSFHVLLM
jgi:hypothetical protein